MHEGINLPGVVFSIEYLCENIVLWPLWES